jgi:Domain of unknown function (DUF4190)
MSYPPDPNSPGQQPPYGRQPYGQQPMASGFPPPYGGYPQPASTNGLAIASLILALTFFCAIAGLICGIIALNQIKTTGQGGRGLAIAGIVISALSITVGTVLFASVGSNN